MENRAEFEKLIVSYLMKELNAEEEKLLIRSIENDTELQARFNQFQLLERLLKVKDGIDVIDIDVEREHLRKLMSERGKSEAADEISIQNGRIRRIRLVKWVSAIAASLIIIAGATWFLSRAKQNREKDIAVETIRERQKPEAVYRSEENNSGKPRSLQLEDGTEILLYDHTELKFKEPFDEDKRTITLIGKASFKVAKDKTRPFT